MGELGRPKGKLRLLALISLSFFVTNAAHSKQDTCDKLLRLQTMNTFNLVIEGMQNPQYKDTGKRTKQDWQLAGMAEATRRFQPDILVLEELESESQTLYWSRKYLNDEYIFFSSGVSDDRGVLTGFLVSKKMAEHFDFTVESHSHELWTNEELGIHDEPLYSRDLPVLWATHSDGERMGTKAFAIVGVHLKSKRPYRGDIESRRLRGTQVERMLKIVDVMQATEGPDFPIIIAGDFNNDLLSDNEVSEVLRRGFVDSVVVMGGAKDQEAVTTFTYFDGKGSTQHQKLDGVLIPSTQASRIKDSYVTTYLDSYEWPIGLPKTFKDKKRLPSDHRPVTAVISY